MPELRTTAPILPSGDSAVPSRLSAMWEAAKRIPSALPQGALIGGTVGLCMAGLATGLESINIPAATLLGGHDVLSSAGNFASFAGHFMAAHAVGHALYDGVVESKATYDKTLNHTNTIAERESMAEKALAQAVERGFEHPVQAVEQGFFDRDDAPPARSHAMEQILARGPQGAQPDWQQRIAARDAERTVSPQLPG